ncbi:MAG: transposase [Alphaproteobacteria bacterium]|nr:transposase [Alphaproteobacteria bacterium]MCB9686172.1 transposase [Alphaproteobacteria bacterium]
MDPEVEPRAKRRSFTGEYKAKILAECDAATESGDIGRILRREGLYSSHLVEWRRLREAGALAGLTPKPVGRPRKERNPLAAEVERLQRENERLRDKVRKAEIIMEAQKKLSEVLGTTESERSPSERLG